MRDAVHTKKVILEASGDLFNTQGYKATSISDITQATGFTKGAIYRHFKNKSDLEQQALRNLSLRMFNALGFHIKEAPDFTSKMEAIFSFFKTYIDTPLYDGGCPLLNAAVEADDTNTALRQQAYNMLAQLKASVNKLIENGIKNNQVAAATSPETYSTLIIASLEGAIMMSKLERNNQALETTIKYLREVIKSITI